MRQKIKIVILSTFDIGCINTQSKQPMYCFRFSKTFAIGYCILLYFRVVGYFCATWFLVRYLTEDNGSDYLAWASLSGIVLCALTDFAGVIVVAERYRTET